MANNIIGITVKQLREEKGFSKYRLAKITGLDEAYIGQLEAGRVDNPRRDTLAALAKGLQVPPCIFFDEDFEDIDIKAFVHGEIISLNEDDKDLIRHSINIVRERVKERDKYSSG